MAKLDLSFIEINYSNYKEKSAVKFTRPFYFNFIFFLSLIRTCSSFSEEKTIFITGGAGFIGSNFLNYMFETYPEYKFIVLDALTYASNEKSLPESIKNSYRYEFIKGNITNCELVDSIMKRSNFVVNFAAETDVTRSINDDLAFIESNILGTRSLLRSLIRNKNIERFVHISTSEVYGTAEQEPMDEIHQLNPRSPYAASKSGADRLVYSYCCTFDIPAVIVRPFNNYGPNQHVEKMLPRFIISAMKGVPLKIEGSGTQRRDWIFTCDTAKGIDAILHSTNFDEIKNNVFNLGTGRAISVLEIAKMVLKEFNLSDDFLIFVEERPGQVDTHISSTDKSENILKWKANTSFQEGLKKTIEWYRNNEEKWNNSDLKTFIKN
jgi:dTDP-glucose 4,6-dehydratase